MAVEYPMSLAWQPAQARLARVLQYSPVPRCPASPAFFALFHLATAGVTLRYSTVPGQETLPGVAPSEAR